ncbi:hypothetical protein L7750_17165 [Xenorhabdus bovienii]|uniref:hypothetical protein n=1 Tax=Xenorhabdus bovienii TaxID=40576 RepID=UPI001EDE7C81|nr:hypothetical protein [Xenorhabdus bovienii]MCG3472051.1 hypothetical protein [Xenorhabdus bovienii]
MKKVQGISYSELLSKLMKKPGFKANYEREYKNPSCDWQIIYHSPDGHEEVIFDSQSTDDCNNDPI